MAQLKSTTINGSLTVTGDVKLTSGASLNTLWKKIRVDQWGSNGETNITTSINGLRAFSVNPNNKPSCGLPSGISDYGTMVIIGGVTYAVLLYISVLGNFAIWSTHDQKWVVVR